jgi:hypothetical protein
MKTFQFLLLSALFTHSIKAAVLTVNNSATGGAQYTQINSAIAAASSGDTLYVSGSVTQYNGVTVTKPLTIIGPGTFNTTPFAFSAKVQSISILAGSSNTSIFGLNIISGSIGLAQNLTTILISNCCFESSALYVPDVGCSNIIIRNNIFSGGNASITYQGTSGGGSTFNVLIDHNIINGFLNSFIDPNTTIQNNTFYNSKINGSTPDAFYNSCKNLVVKNNIFFNSNPSNNISNSLFDNNITYTSGTAYTPLGGTNLDNLNPLFVNAPTTGNYTAALNFHLLSGSPASNAGTDGTDLGYFGGIVQTNPSGELWNMPYIRKMDVLNSNVAPNGTVNVKVRSTKAK